MSKSVLRVKTKLAMTTRYLPLTAPCYYNPIQYLLVAQTSLFLTTTVLMKDFLT